MQMNTNATGQTVAGQIGAAQGIGVQTHGEQYLTFLVDDQEYGVDILSVQEIKGWETATPIPNAPPYVKGVINMRGVILPVVDLRLRFGLEPKAYGATTVVIVLRTGDDDDARVIGIVVDAVSDVYNINGEEIHAPPDLGDFEVEELVQGVAKVGEKVIMVLTTDHLLRGTKQPEVH